MFCLQQSTVDPLETDYEFENLESSYCSTERLGDLKEQVKCAKEGVFFLREKLRKLEEENTNLDREASLSVNKILKMRNSPLFKETYERD